MKNKSRRDFFKIVFAAAVLQLSPEDEAQADNLSKDSPINIMIPKSYSPPVSDSYQTRLAKAVLSYLADNYRGKIVPEWGRKFEEIDFTKRIVNIIYWISKAIQEHQSIYPMDPAFVVAQIMQESFFYEFAVSGALAVGICQFIMPTAHEYGMLCAGDSPEHAAPPFELHEAAGKANEYYQLRKMKKEYIRTQKPTQLLTLENALEMILENKCDDISQKKSVSLQWEYSKKLLEFDTKIRAAREAYKNYLKANIKSLGKDDIFDNTDFFKRFDERFTYKKPIHAMVKYLAANLQARNGNILAAACGYNAGLSSTADSGIYKIYGRIPNIYETATYVSRILIHHHEIHKRL